MRFSVPLYLVFLFVFSLPASAAESTPQFSADTIDVDPMQGERKGRLYVGEDQVRTEFEMNEQTMVQIMDLKRQRVIMLNPKERTYMMRKGGTGGMAAGSGQPGADPCAGMQNVNCKWLGQETIHGRPAQKWEIVNVAGESAEPMTVWLDDQRKFPVRQEMQDGSSMEMRLIGKESVNGRSTEKWEISSSRPGGQSQVSHQWHDPQLKMNIREEHPGGYSRNLVNIKPGAQPRSLFVIPPDYTEMSPPQGSGGRQYR